MGVACLKFPNQSSQMSSFLIQFQQSDFRMLGGGEALQIAPICPAISFVLIHSSPNPRNDIPLELLGLASDSKKGLWVWKREKRSKMAPRKKIAWRTCTQFHDYPWWKIMSPFYLCFWFTFCLLGFVALCEILTSDNGKRHLPEIPLLPHKLSCIYFKDTNSHFQGHQSCLFLWPIWVPH